MRSDQYLIINLQAPLARNIAKGIDDDIATQPDTGVGMLGAIADYQPGIVIKADPITQLDTALWNNAIEPQNRYRISDTTLLAQLIDACEFFGDRW